jgi:hypothetical protein
MEVLVACDDHNICDVMAQPETLTLSALILHAQTPYREKGSGHTRVVPEECNHGLISVGVCSCGSVLS